jgi:drug/metabolite transporter (DMT)-like permease
MKTHGVDHEWDIEDTHVDAVATRGSALMLLALILSSVALAAAAQIVLKHGMNQFFHRTGHSFHFDGPSVRAVVRQPAVWLGLGLFGLSAIVWLGVLSRAALSYAYPFAALTYVVIVVYDFVRGQAVGGLRWAGVALIVAGIVLVSRTPHGGPGTT